MASTHSKLVGSTPIIDGLMPAKVVTPADPQELASILARAAQEGQAVAPIGGGTSLALGNVPERLDLAVSLANISGVISYEPTDLTLSVWAGSRFDEINKILAENGQTLPIDVAFSDRATIGGRIATGIAGPRRSGSPTLRDLLIGVSAAHSSGTVTKAGGMVVKNVTGFDLMRVYLGSLGTLGVVLSANLKVLPVGRRDITVSGTFSNLEKAIEVAGKIRESRVRAVALEVFRSASDWSVAARIEGRETTVQLLADETAQTLEGDVESFEGEASESWWNVFSEKEAPTTNGEDVVLRCSTRPRCGHGLLKKLSIALEEFGGTVDHVSWAPVIGTTTLRCSFNDDENPRSKFLALRDGAMAAAENVTVLAAPPEWKAGMDIWGATPETIDVMRALKEQFDPARILNPGRFVGGI